MNTFLWLKIAISIGILLIIIGVIFYRKKGESKQAVPKCMLALGIILFLVSLAIGLTFSDASARGAEKDYLKQQSIMEFLPDYWSIGITIPYDQSTEVKNDLENDSCDYPFIVYRYDCEECREELNNITISVTNRLGIEPKWVCSRKNDGKEVIKLMEDKYGIIIYQVPTIVYLNDQNQWEISVSALQ